MKCPNCNLLNPDTAQKCDCSFNFETRTMNKTVRKEDLRLCDRGGCGAGILWVIFLIGCLMGLVMIGQLIALACGVEDVGQIRFPALLVVIPAYFLFRRPRTKEEIERRGRCVR